MVGNAHYIIYMRLWIIIFVAVKRVRLGEVGSGAALTSPDAVWHAPLRESAARSSLALTGRCSRRFSSDPLNHPSIKGPRPSPFFESPQHSHVLDTSFTSTCGASRPSTRRLSSRAACLLQEVTPSTAQFHAGGRRPRLAFPVCVVFKPLNSPSAFLWVHRRAVHRLYGGPAVGRHPSHVRLRRPNSSLGQEAILLGVTAPFRPHRRTPVVLRRFPASQYSTGKVLQWLQCPCSGRLGLSTRTSRIDSALIPQGQQGFGHPVVAYKCTAGGRGGRAGRVVALSNSITLSARNMEMAVQCDLEPDGRIDVPHPR
jgi:hypothetical protein